MRFYTKEWYKLMQHQDDTLCMKQLPDKNYSDQEIKALFEKNSKRKLPVTVGSTIVRPSFWICPSS